MNRIFRIITVVIVGCLLVVALGPIAGRLAAIALPRSLFEPFLSHPALAVFLVNLLAIQLPIFLLTLVVGFLMFRSLEVASLELVLWCAVPWLIRALMSAIDYYAIAQLSSLERFGNIVGWRQLPGWLVVPCALWLAAFLSRRAGSGTSMPGNAFGGP
jgi:hypothetical protein